MHDLSLLLTVPFARSSASSFAVAGASGNPDKFGYKLVAWYKSRNLPVTPITPSCASILDIAAVNSIADLSTDLAHTSLSIVTPPKVSLQILKDAAEQKSLLGIWLQVRCVNVRRGDALTEDNSAWRGRRLRQRLRDQ